MECRLVDYVMLVTARIVRCVNSLLDHGFNDLLLALDGVVHSLNGTLVGPWSMQEAACLSNSKAAAILGCVVEFCETWLVFASKR